MEAGRTLAHIIFNDKAAYLSRRALLIPSPRSGGFSAASSCVAEKKTKKVLPPVFQTPKMRRQPRLQTIPQPDSDNRGELKDVPGGPSMHLRCVRFTGDFESEFKTF